MNRIALLVTMLGVIGGLWANCDQAKKLSEGLELSRRQADLAQQQLEDARTQTRATLRPWLSPHTVDQEPAGDGKWRLRVKVVNVGNLPATHVRQRSAILTMEPGADRGLDDIYALMLTKLAEDEIRPTTRSDAAIFPQAEASVTTISGATAPLDHVGAEQGASVFALCRIDYGAPNNPAKDAYQTELVLRANPVGAGSGRRIEWGMARQYVR